MSRDETILELRNSGFTMQQIGNKYRLSRERIRQILHKLTNGNYKRRLFKYKSICCLECNNIFKIPEAQNRIFCSNKCRSSFKTKNKLSEDEVRKRKTEKCRRYRNTENGKKIIKNIAKRQYKKYKKKALARALMNQAVTKGKIIKPEKCSICKKNGYIHGHHKDYNKPLEVIWVCPKCHKDIHTGKLDL